MLLRLFLLFDCFVALQEAGVLGVLGALADVEGQGECLEGVFALELEISFEIVEESLFVANVVVFLQVVVHADRLRFVYLADLLLLVHLYPPLVGALADFGLSFGVFD